MTIVLSEAAIILTGACGVEDVDILVGHMEERPDLAVDLSAATSVHTALWQALMIFRPRLTENSTASAADNRLLVGLRAYIQQGLQR